MNRMTNTTTKQASQTKAEQTQTALAELLATATRRGFYGSATLTLSLQDGHIQHVKVATERMLK